MRAKRVRKALIAAEAERRRREVTREQRERNEDAVKAIRDEVRVVPSDTPVSEPMPSWPRTGGWSSS